MIMTIQCIFSMFNIEWSFLQLLLKRKKIKIMFSQYNEQVFKKIEKDFIGRIHSNKLKINKKFFRYQEQLK